MEPAAPAATPAQPERPRGWFERILPYVSLIILLCTGIQTVNNLWLHNTFTSKEEFRDFKEKEFGPFVSAYWARDKQMNEGLTQIRVGIGKLEKGQDDISGNVQTVRDDVRDLRKTTNPAPRP